ncbi:hypothetical protein J4573_48970 [Actinomadura barringtoniae]|uniref:Uncharacterized protein n=1 Tax=Actinomadura barringtoniae TaxID=1427535 RepID=A0A939TA76_9ACTN|nr:hypothetical protein [Actinomadura barringtoniae]MBO2455094.1 hypothetical protein [Actinomadura barringtoniae]
MHTLELRLTALEARVADVENHFGGQLYQIRRESVATQLNLGKIMDHLGVAAATDAEADEVLDNE